MTKGRASVGGGGSDGPLHHPPNVALLPKAELAQHLPFPRPVAQTSAISDQSVADIDKAILAQVAAALQRTDMGFLWVDTQEGAIFEF